MQLTFCTKYSFDDKKRAARLAALSLSLDEYKLAQQFQRQVIEPNLEHLVTQFFRILKLDDEINHMFAKGFREDKLEWFLRRYLSTLGVNFTEATYFEQRLRMGLAHLNVGVSLVSYQLAYRILQQLLFDAVPNKTRNHDLLQAFVLKITTLDLIIATEAYGHYGKADATTENDEQPVPHHQRQLLGLDRLSDYIEVNKAHDSEALLTFFALVRIDNDHRIEQCYGNETEQQVRNGVVQRIFAELRPRDTMGSVDDGYYLIVLSHLTENEALDVCRRIMDKIAAHPLSADKITIPVTMSAILTHDFSLDATQASIEKLSVALANIQEKGVNQLELFIDADSGG